MMFLLILDHLLMYKNDISMLVFSFYDCMLRMYVLMVPHHNQDPIYGFLLPCSGYRHKTCSMFHVLNHLILYLSSFLYYVVLMCTSYGHKCYNPCNGFLDQFHRLHHTKNHQSAFPFQMRYSQLFGNNEYARLHLSLSNHHNYEVTLLLMYLLSFHKQYISFCLFPLHYMLLFSRSTGFPTYDYQNFLFLVHTFYMLLFLGKLPLYIHACTYYHLWVL